MKYGADIDAADYYPGYAECGEDIRMVIRIPATWDGDENKTREGCEIDIGDTLAGVRRMTNVGGFVVANMHAELFGCKPAALNNRLRRLEELGLITSTKHGRQRRYVAK